MFLHLVFVLGTSIFLQIAHASPTTNIGISKQKHSSGRSQLPRNLSYETIISDSKQSVDGFPRSSYDGMNMRRAYSFSSTAKPILENNIENLILFSNKSSRYDKLDVIEDPTAMINIMVDQQPLQPYTNGRNTSHIKPLQNLSDILNWIPFNLTKSYTPMHNFSEILNRPPSNITKSHARSLVKKLNFVPPNMTKSHTPVQNSVEILNWFHSSMTKNSSRLKDFLTKKYKHKGLKRSADKSPHKNVGGGISYGLSAMKRRHLGTFLGSNYDRTRRKRDSYRYTNKIDAGTRRKRDSYRYTNKIDDRGRRKGDGYRHVNKINDRKKRKSDSYRYGNKTDDEWRRREEERKGATRFSRRIDFQEEKLSYEAEKIMEKSTLIAG